MDLESDEELLSAYLDRELTPDERAVVDRLLASSVEARERLDELSRTSQFMRRLPRTELDSSFAEGVLGRLARESLLRPEPPAPRGVTRRAVWWIGGPVAAAATVLIALHLQGPLVPHPDRSAPRDAATTDAFGTGMSSEFVPELTLEEPVALVAGAAGSLAPGDSMLGLIVVDRVSAIHAIELLLVENNIDFDSEESGQLSSKETDSAGALTVVAIEGDSDQLDDLIRQVAARRGDSPIRAVTVDEPVEDLVNQVRLQLPSEQSGGLVKLSEKGRNLQLYTSSDPSPPEAVGTGDVSRRRVGGAEDRDAAPAAGSLVRQRSVRAAMPAVSAAPAAPDAAALTSRVGDLPILRLHPGGLSPQIGVPVITLPSATALEMPAGPEDRVADTFNLGRARGTHPAMPAASDSAPAPEARGRARFVEVPGTLEPVQTLAKRILADAQEPDRMEKRKQVGEVTRGGRRQALLLIIEDPDPDRKPAAGLPARTPAKKSH